MNFAKELERKLTGSEYSMVAYYIEKATNAYLHDRDSVARESLKDAVAIFWRLANIVLLLRLSTTCVFAKIKEAYRLVGLLNSKYIKK